MTQVRQLLEEGIVKLVIESASDEELALLDQSMKEFQRELTKDQASAQKAGALDLHYHCWLARFSHNSIVENIYTFVIDLFTKTINPIHEGVDEVHQQLHQAIMDRDGEKAVEAVRSHTAIWVWAYKETHPEH